MEFVLKKLSQLLVVIIGISFLTFSLLHFSPEDPAFLKLIGYGSRPSPELLQVTRAKMGLDKPLLEQYVTWMGNTLKGDFGQSYENDKPAIEVFKKYLPSTIKLTIGGAIVSILISFPLGIISAVYKGKFLEKIINGFSLLSISTPNFYLALIFMYIFSLKLKWLPIMGSGEFKHTIMPSLVLGIISSGNLIKQIRVAILEELDKDYVKGARARGLSEYLVIVRNVLKNSMVTIITALGMSIGALLGGAAPIEILMQYNGLSFMAVRAISNRDIPVIQLYTLWMAMVFLIINILVDISYVIFDPKLRGANNAK